MNCKGGNNKIVVALRKESVDRNSSVEGGSAAMVRRSPQGECV